MKYKAKYSGYDFLLEENLLYSLLKNRGVEDPERLLNLDYTCLHNGMLFKNMKKGLECLHRHISKKSRIHVQVDSDTDGNTSAAFIIKYLKKINKDLNITYTLHKGKEHGIILDLISDYEFDLLIVPDAGSNDIKECKKLRSKGVDIIILDHHDIEKENPYAIVINCKDGQYPNQILSGCGVTYKFCKEYDNMFGYNYADSMLELVAVGTIADSVDLRNYETRFLCLRGLELINDGHNSLLQEIIMRNDYQIQGNVNITSVAWSIAPSLNAVIRSGTDKEKLDTFRALLEEEELVKYRPGRSGKTEDQNELELTLQEYVARLLANIRNRQNTIIKKAVKKLNERIKEKELDKNKVLIVDTTETLEKTYTGLVANKLANEYKRPVILLREMWRGTYGGSGRNYNLSPVVDFKDFLLKLNTFNYIQGHPDAFGFSINSDKLIPTRDKINEILKDITIEDMYKVDYEIPIGRLKQAHIKQVGEWEDLWGGALDEPLFAITDIYIPVENIRLLGSRKSFIRFEARGITFVKKYTSEDEYNRMILKQSKGLKKRSVKSLKLDVIGKFKMNKYEENVYPQIEIIDFNSSEGQNFIF
jgi:single-stranded-DNA-specific exonuclease